MKLEDNKKVNTGNGKTTENIIITVSVLAESSKHEDVLKIGEELVKKKVDTITDGGFWIWDIDSFVEFYSPNFRESLGYKGEEDFPSVANSWMEIINPDDKEKAIYNFNKTLNNSEDAPYYQDVTYTKKDGTLLKVTCSGILLNHNGKPKYLIGTHKIIY